jgi:quercetin dioxygenase-like cupin family protein
MAIHFNHRDVTPQAAAAGVARQPLLDEKRVPGIKFRLDRLTLAPGSKFALEVAPGDLAWFQMLDGQATLRRDGGSEQLTDAHVVFLPPGFEGALTTGSGAALLAAVVPDAAALDPAFAASPPAFRVVNWRTEPVLNSMHDARRRIYLVTPKLFGTCAIKGEMIIYPPGTDCPEHHHEGGAHFMYFVRGTGTYWADGKPFGVRAGDVVYYHDRERHYLRAGDEEMVFSEFFVPGEVKTVWVEPEKVCTWLPTGRNIEGGQASREIKRHSHAEPADI